GRAPSPRASQWALCLGGRVFVLVVATPPGEAFIRTAGLVPRQRDRFDDPAFARARPVLQQAVHRGTGLGGDAEAAFGIPLRRFLVVLDVGQAQAALAAKRLDAGRPVLGE